MEKGIFKGVLLTLGILSLFGVVFAVGFHTASEITSGNFLGNYSFNGKVDFTNATIVGNGSSSMFTGWPDVIICRETGGRVWTFVLAAIPDGADYVRYSAPSGDGGTDRYLRYDWNKDYYDQSGTTGFNCLNKNITELYDAGQAFNLVGGFDNHKISCPTGFTAVESNGHQLGCMQDSTEGAANCIDASISCFNKYGARLPSLAEYAISKNQIGFTISQGEWLEGTDIYNEGSIKYGCGMYHPSDMPTAIEYSSSRNYRCFIPN